LDGTLNDAEANDSLDDFPEEHQAGACQADIARSSGAAAASADPSVEARNGDHSALAIYLRELRRCRQISADRARRCCQTMHDAADAKTPGARRVDRAEEAFRASYNEMVEGNLALVVRIARPYERFGLPFEDLIQEGNLGLLAAIRQFDPERGVPFPAYATGWIRQAICRAISIKSRTIRIPLDVLGLRRRACGPTWNRRAAIGAAAPATRRHRPWRTAPAHLAFRRTVSRPQYGASRRWSLSMHRLARKANRCSRPSRTWSSRIPWSALGPPSSDHSSVLLFPSYRIVYDT